MISAQLSVIEAHLSVAQLIPGCLVSKIAMGGGLASPPHYIWGWGSARLKIVATQLSTVGAQLNQPDL